MADRGSYVALASIGFLMALACSPGGKGVAVVDTLRERDAILATSARHVAAWKSEQPDTIAALYTHDGLLLAPNTPDVRGQAAISAFARAALDAVDIEELNVQPEDVAVSGDLAYERGNYDERVRTGDRSTLEQGRYLSIWQRQADGSWRMHAFIGNARVAAGS